MVYLRSSGLVQGMGTLPASSSSFSEAANLPPCMEAKNLFRTPLIAPCGMDCALCSACLRKKNRCGGCSAPDRLCTITCTIAACERVKDRYRHTCGAFPCRRLNQLDKRYRTKYQMSMPDNLAAIRKDGIRAFVKSERERWTCTGCGGTIDVHHGRCAACGEEPEEPGKE